MHLNGPGVTIRHTTITENAATSVALNDQGGGIALEYSAFPEPPTTIFSSIISGNQGGDLRGPAGLVSGGYNLIGDGTRSAYFTGTGDQVGITDPRLSPLGYFGGPHPTMLPMQGSPAIDAGSTDATSPFLDPRGEARVEDGDGNASAVADVGAAEAGTLASTHFVVTHPGDSGAGSLRQAIADARVPGSRITFAAGLDGASIGLTSGELPIGDQSVVVDAADLATGVTLDAGGASRVLCVAVTGEATLRGLTVTGGASTGGIFLYDDGGGGIWNDGRLAIVDSTVTGNTSTSSGGGIQHRGLAFEAIRTEFSNNTSNAGGGGGLHNFGRHCALKACSFSNNHAVTGDGGGIHSGASIAMFDSSLWGNTADEDGGAVHILTLGLSVFDQCTLHGNTAGVRGGAVSSNAFRRTELVRCTVTANTAPAGAGAFVIADIGSLTNELTCSFSIIADNYGGDVDRDATKAVFVSEGYNLVGSGNGVGDFGTIGDQTFVLDARLTEFLDFGGPVPTVHLLPGSPAIDAGPPIGTSSEFPFDQRGFNFARAVDGNGNGTPVTDIGAVEFAPLPAIGLVVTNKDDAGPGSLRDTAGAALPGSVITFAPSLDAAEIALTGGPVALDVPFVKIDAGALSSGITVSGNSASRVFEVGPASVVDLCNLGIVDGFSIDCGGGVYNQGVLTMESCTVANCTAYQQGGGICNELGRLTLRNSTLGGNFAVDGTDPTVGRGGGLWSVGDYGANQVTVEQCTIAHNEAGEFGGGIYNYLGRMEVTHSTISKNIAGMLGGGIATFGDLSTETTVFSSIIANNTPKDIDFVLDPANRFTSYGYNLVGFGNASGAFTGPGDTHSVADPGLAALDFNGGPTPTMILLHGSPARDAGTISPAMPLTDQRGFTRVFGPITDIGACEASGAGGYPVWAAEFIAPGDDRTFSGNANNDSSANGLEYATDTTPDALERIMRTQPDPDFPAGGPFTLEIHYRPEAFDVIWRVLRSPNGTSWMEIYNYDGVSETSVPFVGSVLDPAGRLITITDPSPGGPTALYRLEVIYTP